MPLARDSDHSRELDLFLAEWVRGRLSPSDAVQRATSALEAGCEHESIAVVAGVSTRHPTLADVEPALERLLADLGRMRPSPDAALKVLVDDCERRIADGRTGAVAGAWEMFDFSVNEDESVEFLDQVRRFVDLVCDWANAGRPDPPPDTAITGAARAFLERGGLTPMPGDRG